MGECTTLVLILAIPMKWGRLDFVNEMECWEDVPIDHDIPALALDRIWSGCSDE